jgi:hypothetical protein
MYECDDDRGRIRWPAFFTRNIVSPPKHPMAQGAHYAVLPGDDGDGESDSEYDDLAPLPSSSLPSLPARPSALVSSPNSSSSARRQLEAVSQSSGKSKERVKVDLKALENGLAKWLARITPRKRRRAHHDEELKEIILSVFTPVNTTGWALEQQEVRTFVLYNAFGNRPFRQMKTLDHRPPMTLAEFNLCATAM